MKISACFFPPFADAADLSDAYFKAAWYSAATLSQFESFVFPVQATLAGIIEHGAIRPPILPAYFDPATAEVAAQFAAKVVAFNASDIGSWKQSTDTVTHILVHNIEASAEAMRDNPFVRAIVQSRLMVNVDRATNPNDADTFAGFFWAVDETGNALIDDSRAKLTATIAKIKAATPSRAYIFGSGPSVSGARGGRFNDGVSLVCNTSIADEDLVRTIRPKFIHCVDAALHAGATNYAGRFRDALKTALNLCDALIVTRPSLHRLLAQSLPAEFSDRIVSHPFVADLPWTFELDRAFATRDTGNVLTMSMLPLAATLAPRIELLGCDGRSRKSDAPLWDYFAGAKFEALMSDVAAAHPAFVGRDQDAYVARHERNLEDLIGALESEGRTVRSLAPSYLRALAARYTA